MKRLIKQILKEEMEKYKKGSPEELVGLLKFLPINETALYLTELILNELIDFYQNDITPTSQTYTYQPKDKCLNVYKLNITYRGSNNMTGLGGASQHHLHIKYLFKDSLEYQHSPDGGLGRFKRRLFNIIKHECSHFYLEQRGVEQCLYHTHPEGMKKYYYDRQELVLHTREIFDDFVDDNPYWQKESFDSIKEKINYSVKNLRSHTNIGEPFGGGLQKKYTYFIMNNYIKPNINNPKYSPPKPKLSPLTQSLVGLSDAKDNTMEIIKDVNNPKPVSFNKTSRIIKTKIYNKEYGVIEIRIIIHKVREGENITPIVLVYSKDRRGEQKPFNSIEELIKFLVDFKVSDYIMGD